MLTDDDGIDGPWERAMERAMNDDASAGGPRVGVASQADPADERLEARCPECGGSGVDAHGGRLPQPCGRCDGERTCEVRGDEVVTVKCRPCDGEGGGYEESPAGDLWVSCGRCDGEGELTGPADEVCS